MNPPRVQFATTDDAIRIAFTVVGDGYPVFWLPHFLASHVQLEWDFPQHYVYSFLGQQLKVVRFDGRGLGLSDRATDDISIEARMRDIDAVAKRNGFETFALMGIEGGGNLAVSFAAAYPNRVSHLVLVNWTPRFSEANSSRLRALGVLMRTDWELFTENIGTSSFGFDTPLAKGYAKLVRASVTQEMAERYGDTLAAEEMMERMERVQCETLVLHSEKNSYASAESMRVAAATIPDASMVAFEGGLAEHITPMLQQIRSFVVPAGSVSLPVPEATAAEPAELPFAMTTREVEILVMLANGLSNREIAEKLVLSPRTVERHIENLYRKAGFRNRAEATAFAYTNGLVEPT